MRKPSHLSRILLAVASLLSLSLVSPGSAQPLPPSALIAPPLPLIDNAHSADWVFAFKFNAATFPTTATLSDCRFGGTPKTYRSGQRYAVATSAAPSLVDGVGLIGTTVGDPLGATFDSIYNSALNFVVWNDQFYRHPPIRGCSESCAGPWGHSKGIIAWNDVGEGVVIQVTTPSWPGSGTASHPRKDDGNTLGCVGDVDVKASQHFFALRLSPNDTAWVLHALVNASVVTDTSNPQLARIGGPSAIQQTASALGHKSASTVLIDTVLSTGVRMISKPSAMHVPPWQMLSARLGTIPLRAATWWASPRIPTTRASTAILCWDSSLETPAGVEIALTGSWSGHDLGLKGGPNDDANHAKIGVSTDADHHYSIFADLNQQGRLTAGCKSNQNGRGGLFFIVDNVDLHASLSSLIAGATAGTEVPGMVRPAPVQPVH